MSVILVIGPSGVGKSDYGAFAARKIPGGCFHDLDDEVARREGCSAGVLLPAYGADRFTETCGDVVRELARGNSQRRLLIIAVGAGALESARAAEWIFTFPHTLAVMAPPAEVYARGGARNISRSLAQFTACEYSKQRCELYRRCAQQCDVTGLALQEARERFASVAHEIGGG